MPPPMRVDELRMRVEAPRSSGTSPDCAAPRSARTACASVSGRRGPFAWTSRAEQLDRFVAPLLGDLMNRAAIHVGRCGIEARGECATDCFDIPGAGGFEHALAVAGVAAIVVDVRLQRAPAPEAVVAGDGRVAPGAAWRSGCLARSSASRCLAVFLSQSMLGRAGRACDMAHLLSLRPARSPSATRRCSRKSTTATVSKRSWPSAGSRSCGSDASGFATFMKNDNAEIAQDYEDYGADQVMQDAMAAAAV